MCCIISCIRHTGILGPVGRLFMLFTRFKIRPLKKKEEEELCKPRVMLRSKGLLSITNVRRGIVYLYELPVGLIHLAENAGSVFHKVFDRIHVVEGDEKDVLRPGTEEHLVLESHGHQVIEL